MRKGAPGAEISSKWVGAGGWLAGWVGGRGCLRLTRRWRSRRGRELLLRLRALPPQVQPGTPSFPGAPSERAGFRALSKLRTDGARSLPGRAGRRLTGKAGSGSYRCQGAGWKAERDTPSTAAGSPVKTSGGACDASWSREKRAAAEEEEAAGSPGESEVGRREGDPAKAGVFGGGGGAGLRRPADARDRSTWDAVSLPRADQRRLLQIHRGGEGGRALLALPSSPR